MSGRPPPLALVLALAITTTAPLAACASAQVLSAGVTLDNHGHTGIEVAGSEAAVPTEPIVRDDIAVAPPGVWSAGIELAVGASPQRPWALIRMTPFVEYARLAAPWGWHVRLGGTIGSSGVGASLAVGPDRLSSLTGTDTNDGHVTERVANGLDAAIRFELAPDRKTRRWIGALAYQRRSVWLYY